MFTIASTQLLTGDGGGGGGGGLGIHCGTVLVEYKPLLKDTVGLFTIVSPQTTT